MEIVTSAVRFDVAFTLAKEANCIRVESEFYEHADCPLLTLRSN